MLGGGAGTTWPASGEVEGCSGVLAGFSGVCGPVYARSITVQPLAYGQARGEPEAPYSRVSDLNETMGEG